MGTFGERLHDAMLVRGVSVSALARKCRVSRKTIADWFRMKDANLSGLHMVECAEILRVRTRWLAKGLPPMVSVALEQERQARLPVV